MYLFQATVSIKCKDLLSGMFINLNAMRITNLKLLIITSCFYPNASSLGDIQGQAELENLSFSLISSTYEVCNIKQITVCESQFLH